MDIELRISARCSHIERGEMKKGMKLGERKQTRPCSTSPRSGNREYDDKKRKQEKREGERVAGQ